MRTRKQRKTSRREGAALLIALLALAGLSILGLSLMLVTETELQVSNDERLRKQALYAAEAGIEHALIYLRGIDPEVYGTSTTDVLGVLSGDPANDWTSSGPPDDKKSWNDPIVAGENTYDPAKPWLAPALARKGNILWFCVNNARCSGANKPWFDGASGSTAPNRDYALRDVPFERSAGLTGAWDVGTFKSRYTVYVRNNFDDLAIPKPIPSPPYRGGEKSIYEEDKDSVVVLTAEGIVDVGQSSVPNTNDYYKVVRTVEVSVRTSSKQIFDDTSNGGGGGGAGNGLRNDTPEQIQVNRGAPTQRNKDWK